MRLPTDLSVPVRRLGLIGGLSGIAAGFTQVVWGSEISSWSGAKQDPVALGAVTIALATVAVVAASSADRARTGGQRAALATALLVPAVVCFTTVGALWWGPGSVLLVAGTLAAVHAYRAGDVRRAVARWWGEILVGTLAAIYFVLGVTALGLLGLLALGGAGAIVAALWQATRSRTTATVLLIAGAVPFAVAGWWSVVAPLTGILVLAIGIPLVRRAAPRHLHPTATAQRVERATRST